MKVTKIMKKALLILSLVLIALSYPSYACDVNDPEGMNCAVGEAFSTFTCKCESLEVPEAINCKTSIQMVENFLQSQPRECLLDMDCHGYYYRIGVDGGYPIILPKRVNTEGFKQQILELQTSARENCGSESLETSSSPHPFQAACINNLCTNLIE